MEDDAIRRRRLTNSFTRTSTGRHSEFAIPHSRRSSQALLIPESPPPAYTPVNLIVGELPLTSTSVEVVASSADLRKFSYANYFHFRYAKLLTGHEHFLHLRNHLITLKAMTSHRRHQLTGTANRFRCRWRCADIHRRAINSAKYSSSKL